VILGVVEFTQIVEVIWVSLLAGVGITTVFSLVVLGLSRYGETTGAARAAYGTLAAVALVVFFGGLILGVQIMLTKGS
jgi:cytochrome c biogenesis protein CcdA